MAAEPIYLDHHATTPVDPRVLEAMEPYWRRDFGNAASRGHLFGWRAEAAVEDARERIAAAIGAEPREIVFTSGATESNNLALLGAARARRRGHVVTVATEHKAVLDPVRALEREGFRVTRLPVEADGLLELPRLEEALADDTVLVSVMAANNEIGVLQPVQEAAGLCRERGIPLHSDAAQALGKIPLDLAEWPADLVSATAHKLYGPKGVGFLFVRNRRPRVRIAPLFHGGGHERGLRSGTLPVPLVAGMARAVELAVAEREADAVRMGALRDRLRARLEAELPGVHVHGDLVRRLPGNLNCGFEGVDGEKLLLALPRLAVSTGSACTSASPEPSHVLAALGVPEALARASLRFGVGRETTGAQIEAAADQVVAAVASLRGEAR
ncbi:MAG: aminotransferase class V-fold PLP-dependent enzyme [Proteobacteria bacterium]|nr:aminotransferase class V-fold PLP-dependent enzyme [Pseudomonadota bacterium]